MADVSTVENPTERVTQSAPESISDAEIGLRSLRDALQRLDRILPAVALLYVPVALSHLVFLTSGQLVMLAVGLGCSAALFAGWRWLRANPSRIEAASWLNGLVYATVIAHSLLRLYYAHQPGDLMFVGVLAVAVALLPAQIGLHVAATLAYTAGWSALVLALEGRATWLSLAAPLLVTMTLSIAIRWLELRRDRRLFEMQIHAERRRSRLRYDSRHDALTGLANRMRFSEALQRAVQEAGEEERSFSVLYLDLDRFKVINDSLGHQVGDRLLQSVADRLTDNIRTDDLAARFGGDEFALLLSHVDGPDGAIHVAERIHESLATPFGLEDYELEVGASIGIAMYKPEYDTPEAMLRDADTAMYEAKSGHRKHVIFDSEMRARAMARLELESELRTALREERFEVHYQPVLRRPDGELFALEALVRWNHPVRGILEPRAFLPLAEETGHIVAIGQNVLETACREAARWLAADDGLDFEMAINLSTRQLVRSDIERAIEDVLATCELDPSHMIIEVPEAALEAQTELVRARIRHFEALGVSTVIDDFGAGGAAIKALDDLPIRAIKLSRDLITGPVDGDKTVEPVLAAIVTLAQTMDIPVIAKGVETMTQMVRLEALGIELWQGDQFARPMPANELEAYLDHHRDRDTDAA